MFFIVKRRENYRKHFSSVLWKREKKLPKQLLEIREWGELDFFLAVYTYLEPLHVVQRPLPERDELSRLRPRFVDGIRLRGSTEASKALAEVVEELAVDVGHWRRLGKKRESPTFLQILFFKSHNFYIYTSIPCCSRATPLSKSWNLSVSEL